MSAVGDLPYLSKIDLMMALAREIQKLESRLELLVMVEKISGDRDLSTGQTKELVDRIATMKGPMEAELLMLRSTVHWLMKEKA